MQIRMTLLGPIPAEYGSGIHLHLCFGPLPTISLAAVFYGKAVRTVLWTRLTSVPAVLFSSWNRPLGRGLFMYR